MEITADSGLDVVDRRAKRAREPLKFRLYAWSLFGLDWCVLGVGLLLTDNRTWLAPELLLWAAVATLLDLPSIPAGKGGRYLIGMDLPVLLAAGYLFGPIAGGLVAFFGSADPRELRREVSLTRAMCNRAQISLSVMAAATLFHLIGGTLESPLSYTVAALAGLVLDVVLNHFSVLVGMSLLTKKSLRDAWEVMVPEDGPVYVLSYAGLGAMSVLLVALNAQFGVWSILAFTLPLILIRQAFARAYKLNEADKRIRLKNEALSELTNQIASERLDERTRIASSLHDDVISSLHGVTIHAQVIKEDLRNGLLLQLDDDVPALIAAAQSAADVTRAAIQDLRSSELGRQGLEGSLRQLALEAEELRPDVGIEVAVGAVDLGPELQLIVYQVARESIANAIRHSDAGDVVISLRPEGASVRLEIQDNGIGFDPCIPAKAGHFGLQLMRERVEAVGGCLSIDSEPGVGTCVVVSLGVRD